MKKLLPRRGKAFAVNMPTDIANQPLVVSAEEAAKLLGLNKRTILRLIDRGIFTRIPHVGRIRIPYKQIVAYANSAPTPFCPLLSITTKSPTG